MTTPEIQELLEGMLSDEQTAEVLHRVSVSPEKLSAFRQHVALRGAFERDARAQQMTEEEDDAVWAAVLGATGGLVTGGTIASTGGWIARAAAFVATGLAGFFIGNAVNSSSDTPAATTGTLPLAAQESMAEPSSGLPSWMGGTSRAAESAGRLAALSAEESTRVDTVIRTVYVPKVVYKDRIVVQQVNGTASEPNQQNDLAALTPEQKDLLKNLTAINGSEFNLDLSGEDAFAKVIAAQGGELADNSEKTSNMLDGSGRQDQSLDPSATVREDAIQTDSSDSQHLGMRTDDQSKPTPSDLKIPTNALMRRGIEIGYSERIGRIAQPVVREDATPDFNIRSLDFTMTGQPLQSVLTGGGIRVTYGSFPRVVLQEQTWFGLGVSDTVLVSSLESIPEFSLEGFGTVRFPFPIFSDRLALNIEPLVGLSSSHYKVGGDISVIAMITNWLGARAGIGYGYYWYTTQAEREQLGEYRNAGISDELQSGYRGSLLEGRYGLFYKF